MYLTRSWQSINRDLKNPERMKRQKMTILELGDLSDEIILKVLGFLDIKNLLRVGHVSNRLRSDISINLTNNEFSNSPI